MIRLFKEYNKAKKYFVKPKLYWKFGNWFRDPCLPVWRRSYTDLPYKLFKRHCYYDSKQYKYIWNDKFGNVLKKFGLGWFQPRIDLPNWLAFHFFNLDVTWKTKWTSDDIRFEFPPSVTFVAFGYSLSFWVQWPNSYDAYDYWECLLKHNYITHDLESLMRRCGIQTSTSNGTTKTELVLKKEFIKPEYHDLYDDVASYMKYQYEQKCSEEYDEFTDDVDEYVE